MKAFSGLALLAASLVAVIGCSAGQDPAGQPGALTPTQEANARTLGIATPESVKQNAGAYAGSVQWTQSTVEDQQKRVAAENAAIQSMSGGAH